MLQTEINDVRAGVGLPYLSGTYELDGHAEARANALAGDCTPHETPYELVACTEEADAHEVVMRWREDDEALGYILNNSLVSCGVAHVGDVWVLILR
jgi:hypothetical protein